MSAAQQLSDLIHQQIIVDGFGLPCFLEPEQFKVNNLIAIFYNTDTETNVQAWHLGRHSKIGYYRTPIKVTVRHNKYNKARDAAFDTMEFLSVNRNGIADATIQLLPENQAPIFDGVDQSGGNNWTIELNLIGGK